MKKGSKLVLVIIAVILAAVSVRSYLITSAGIRNSTESAVAGAAEMIRRLEVREDDRAPLQGREVREYSEEIQRRWSRKPDIPPESFSRSILDSAR